MTTNVVYTYTIHYRCTCRCVCNAKSQSTSVAIHLQRTLAQHPSAPQLQSKPHMKRITNERILTHLACFCYCQCQCIAQATKWLLRFITHASNSQTSTTGKRQHPTNAKFSVCATRFRYIKTRARSIVCIPTANNNPRAKIHSSTWRVTTAPWKHKQNHCIIMRRCHIWPLLSPSPLQYCCGFWQQLVALRPNQKLMMTMTMRLQCSALLLQAQVTHCCTLAYHHSMKHLRGARSTSIVNAQIYRWTCWTKNAHATLLKKHFHRKSVFEYLHRKSRRHLNTNM